MANVNQETLLYCFFIDQIPLKTLLKSATPSPKICNPQKFKNPQSTPKIRWIAIPNFYRILVLFNQRKGKLSRDFQTIKEGKYSFILF